MLRRTGTILVAAAFFAVSTGISVFYHNCKSSHHTDIQVYPELFPVSGTCCSPWEHHDTSCDEGHAHKISANRHCCDSAFIQFRVPVFTNSFIPKINPPCQDILFTGLAWTGPGHYIVKGEETPCLEGERPPPLMYGRQLVLCIHQIRIPS